MTKEEIQQKIIEMNKKIETSNAKIQKYKNEITKLEDSYSVGTKMTDYINNSIEDYYSELLSKISMLDRDSAFGEYYRNEIDKIMNGSEVTGMQNTISKGKKDIISSIDSYESKIYEEQKNIRYYKSRIDYYQKQLSMLP